MKPRVPDYEAGMDAYSQRDYVVAYRMWQPLDLRKVHRECEDGHKDLARTLKDRRRLERLERLLTERR